MKKITMTEYNKMKAFSEKAVENIPASRNRIIAKTRAAAQLKKLDEITAKKPEIDTAKLIGKTATILHVTTTNLGTRKFADCFSDLDIENNVIITRETEASIFYKPFASANFERHISKDKIKAVICRG